MQDTNWKTYALMAVIGLGLLAQLMKQFPTTGGGPMPWDSAVLRTGKLSLPYSVKVASQRPKSTLPRSAETDAVLRAQLNKYVAANAPVATDTQAPPEKGAEGKAAAKKVEDKCDEKNPKIDPKSGLPIACKKKKKKEKKEEIAAEPIYVTPKSTTDDHPSSIDQAIGMAAGSGEIPQPLPNKPDDAFDTLENWQKLLLNSPNLAETKRFIDHYQRNLVTADVFYKITQMMMDDSRADMKSLGVLCAGLTPSVVSFQMLATLQKTERSDSAPYTQAEQFLTRYSELGSLSVLERVLKSPSATYPAVIAAQKLNTAAHRYLVLGTAANASPTPKQTATLVKNVTLFQRFVTILQNLEHSTDSAVVDSSRRTLGDLQTLLAAATPPTNTNTVPPVAGNTPN